MVRTLTIHLVSNYYVAQDCMRDACSTVLARFQPDIPKGVKVDIKLETTLDVIFRIIDSQNRQTQGRRYGHAALDIARELNRYLHPNIRRAGRGRESTDLIKKLLAERFKRAFRVDEHE